MSRVIVSAHLDDAVLSAFSALVPGTTVVTVFCGTPPAGSLAPWDAESGAVDSAVRVAERCVEDQRALAGLAEVVHLELADEQYVDAGLMPAPGAAAIAKALGPYLDADDLYVPAALDNTDHLRVRDAILAVRSQVTLYADLPYALRCGFGDDAGAVDVTLDDVQVTAKLAAVRAYATQLEILERGFGAFVTKAGLGRERFWPRPKAALPR